MDSFERDCNPYWRFTMLRSLVALPAFNFVLALALLALFIILIIRMKSILLGIIVLNVIVILIGVLLMFGNLVASPAFNIGLALTIIGSSIILITREIKGR